jgi:uncharacterized membrane protein YdfJ with MMPL/SSD domain
MAAMPITVLTEIGFAIAVGVLFDALVVRTLLVPALGFWLGRAMWWPAKMPQGHGSSPSRSFPTQLTPPPAAEPQAPAPAEVPGAYRLGGSSRYR